MSGRIMTREEALDAALALARGWYQEALILGDARLSGGDLRGRAKEYSARYRESRENLLSRIEENGIPYAVEPGRQGRLLLIFGTREAAIASEASRLADETREAAGPYVPQLARAVNRLAAQVVEACSEGRCEEARSLFREMIHERRRALVEAETRRAMRDLARLGS